MKSAAVPVPLCKRLALTGRLSRGRWRRRHQTGVTDRLILRGPVVPAPTVFRSSRGSSHRREAPALSRVRDHVTGDPAPGSSGHLYPDSTPVQFISICIFVVKIHRILFSFCFVSLRCVEVSYRNLSPLMGGTMTPKNISDSVFDRQDIFFI